MRRRCSTPVPCQFDRHCAHRKIPMQQCSGFFWPPNTGEACQHYEHHADEVELVEKLVRMAGAHS